MTDGRKRIKELLSEKNEAEKEIDEIWRRDAEERKRRETLSPAQASPADLPSGGMARVQRVDAIRKRVAKINDELMVSLLESIDAHSRRLEWLTYALILTSAALITLTGYQVWRLLG